MREILFRGKRKDNGEWVYGWLIIGYDHRYYIVSYTDVNCLRGRNKPYATWRSIEVIPETVGQFTGLTDKNGKKIFDGDIVKKGFDLFVVKWNDNQCKYDFYIGDYVVCGFNRDTMLYFEIIGNIHDNPELLKGGDENN